MTPVFLSWEFPLFFLAATLIVIFLSRKPLEHFMGPLVLDPRAIFILFVLLFSIGFGLDTISTYFDVNDTHNVTTTANALAAIPLFAIVFLFISALAEEAFFRGILQTLIGPIVSTILFAIVHAGYDSSIQLLGALLAGLVLAVGKDKFNSIYPGFVAHFLYNVAAVFVRL